MYFSTSVLYIIYALSRTTEAMNTEHVPQIIIYITGRTRARSHVIQYMTTTVTTYIRICTLLQYYYTTRPKCARATLVFFFVINPTRRVTQRV